MTLFLIGIVAGFLIGSHFWFRLGVKDEMEMPKSLDDVPTADIVRELQARDD